MQDWAAHLLLRDHPYPVGCLAWSLDDSLLLTSTEHFIKMWNTNVNTLSNWLTVVHLHQMLQTGACIRTLDEHTGTVTAVSWLPDGTGFITGALDRKVIIWVCFDPFPSVCRNKHTCYTYYDPDSFFLSCLTGCRWGSKRRMESYSYSADRLGCDTRLYAPCCYRHRVPFDSCVRARPVERCSSRGCACNFRWEQGTGCWSEGNP